MIISARNLAAALAYEGADIEDALLELASVAPSLDARVRRALFPHERLPKLRFISDRHSSDYHFVYTPQPRWACAMHAVDQICKILEDSSVVQYLRSRFPEYNMEVLIERGL